MDIHNLTRFTKEGYYSMNREIGKKAISLLLIMEVLFIGAIIYLWISDGFDLLIKIFITVLGVTYPFISILINKLLVARQYRLNKMVYDGMSYEFNFHDDEFKVVVRNNQIDGESVIKYKTLHHVIENQNFIFIFINARTSYIVDKKQFDNSSDIDLLKKQLLANSVSYKVSKSK
ncbi:MAG: YcxB family protein [Bacillales bacterium]|nr:YcxB family protein [Bacillales bacterium]